MNFKKYLLIPLLFIVQLASAFTIEIVPATATECGYVIYKNDHYAIGQMAIVLAPGIGEVGPGTVASLTKISKVGYANTKNDPFSIASATDYFGYNVVMVQPKKYYGGGEFQSGYNYALRVLKADSLQIHLSCISLGGYGFSRDVSSHPEIAKLFSTITIIVMGPGILANSAKAIADSKTPTYFWTSTNDTTKYDAAGKYVSGSGTTYKVTEQLFNAVKAAGGNTWLSEWTTPGRGHGGTFTGIYSGVGKAHGGYNIPINAAIGKGTMPKVLIYEWMKSNSKGKVVDPLTVPSVIVTPPVIVTPSPVVVTPTPAPVPIKRIIETINIYSDSTYSRTTY